MEDNQENPKKIQPRMVDVHALPDEMIARVLKQERGLQWLAAEKLGISGSWLSTRIAKSEYLQDVRAACLEKRIDIAERGLSRLTEKDDLGGVTFTLKTIGKKRGYSETQTVAVDKETMEHFTSLMSQIAEEQRRVSSSKDHSPSSSQSSR